MAQWKKIIVSGSDAHLASVTASNLTANELVIAGTGGALESSGFSYDSGNSLLEFGNITVSASAFSGSFFIGDGTGLTGVTAEFPSTPLGGTSLDTVKFYVNDGANKFISGSQVDDYVYSGVSGDATIAADGTLTIANTVIEGANLSSSVADGTTIDLTGGTLSTLKVPNALTDVAGGGLNDFSFDGSSAVSLEISGAVDLTDNIIIKWDDTSGKFVDSSLTDDGSAITGTTSIQLTGASSNLSGSFSGSFFGDGTGLTGVATDLSIAGDDGTGTVALDSQTLTINGTANEITASVSGQTVTIGLPDNVVIGNNLTVTGDLVVTGDQQIQNVANLAVDDKYILINSGSSAAGDESGIIFGGSNGAVNNGAALIWNGDYNSNDGRLAIANSVNADALSATPDYHLAGVFSGTAAAAATAQADHEGNIRVDSSGDIFIYVAD